MTKRRRAEKPIYPHTEYVQSLYNAMGERNLSREESQTLLNSRMFESLIESWIPELRDICSISEPTGIEFENAQTMTAEACRMADALAGALTLAASNARRIQVATQNEVDRIIAEAKRA